MFYYGQPTEECYLHSFTTAIALCDIHVVINDLIHEIIQNYHINAPNHNRHMYAKYSDYDSEDYN